MRKPLSKARLADYRSAAYVRNHQYLREFKEAKGCEECETSYPHYVLDTIPSLSVMASSRCSLDQLKAACAQAKVVCANCRRTLQWNEKEKAKS